MHIGFVLFSFGCSVAATAAFEVLRFTAHEDTASNGLNNQMQGMHYSMVVLLFVAREHTRTNLPSLSAALVDVYRGACWSGALKAYKKSLELHRQLAKSAPQENGHAPESPPATVPSRLLNNAAVVHMACGKQREALNLAVEASQVHLRAAPVWPCPEAINQ